MSWNGTGTFLRQMEQRMRDDAMRLNNNAAKTLQSPKGFCYAIPEPSPFQIWLNQRRAEGELLTPQEARAAVMAWYAGQCQIDPQALEKGNPAIAPKGGL